jgi:DNA-binding transcriptional MerR regulator/effector-binding domain-containing protein
MTVKLSIGDFSRMTYLTVKALRHYHDIGVLEPVEVDASSGYRYYAPRQVAIAQTVRRLRDLGMPLEEIRVIVKEPEGAARDRVLVEHLQRMEAQLAQTQLTVASLRALIQQSRPPEAPAERRRLAAATAIAIESVIRAEDAVATWIDAFTLLHRWLATGLIERTGPDGALFAAEFFEDGLGTMTVFIPVTRVQPDAPLPPRARMIEVPAVDVAVMNHDGPLTDLDLTYGALGTWVLEQASVGDGPIREYYLPTGDPDDLLAHSTEVCWPVQPG